MRYDITVKDLSAAVTVEKYIRKALPALTDSSIREAFARRDVKIDGLRVPKGTPVHNGSAITLYAAQAAGQRLCVVYEDEHVLLVNKPRGISVHGDEGFGATVLELAQAYLHSESVCLCHRLDNQTSGLLLLAKDADSEKLIRSAFAHRNANKTYLCLARGPFSTPEAEKRDYLRKDALAGRVSIFPREVSGAVPIITRYRVLENGEVSRVRISLITGRTHQIRAHLAYLGHPVLGDDVYGDRLWNKQNSARSLMLCAVELSLCPGGHLRYLDDRVFKIPEPF